MLALVTGAGGFLGRYIVEKLVASNYQVRSLSRAQYPFLQSLGVEHIAGDIRNNDTITQAMHGVDVVFHVAAKAGIWGNWNDYFSINTQGTINLLNIAKHMGVGRFVYTSSPSVTFGGQDQQGISEQVGYPAKYLCHYAHTKALGEQAVLAANESEKFHTCALRPHLIWGPRDSHLIPRLIERARSGKLRQVGAGCNRIDTIFVTNAADAHLQAAQALEPSHSKAAGKAYFLSQGEPVNCWDWINQILALVQLPPVKKKISYGLAYFAGTILEAWGTITQQQSEPRMTRFLAAQLATDHWFDLTAARRDFGYNPAINMAAGMQRLHSWLQESSFTASRE